MTAMPNHAGQGTTPCVTVRASAAAFPPTVLVPGRTPQSLSLGSLRVELSDGRIVSAPLAWFPRLQHGTVAERNHWRLIGGGEGINWPDLDEDISVENLLAGQPSGESQKSLQRWLDTRQAKPSAKSRAPRQGHGRRAPKDQRSRTR
ncbi:hypothetical protein LBMAG56_54140 [Verrucomicrobiota bacterium]|nr:hypothetical protein LBMAG56_54140 [Verrucomicrobiota bacterium]